MSDLKQIFEGIVPENIKEIPLMQTAMDIFLTNLEKNSAVAFDISKVYDNYLNIDPNDLTLQGKTNLRGSLLNIYLQTLYNVIKAAQGDKVLQKKLEISGIDSSVTLNNVAEQILGTEFFVTNKTFKESVGTKTGINYSHAVARTLESNKDTTDPVITEIKPFHFLIDGPLTSEMYASIVKPLSHPLGFTYGYRQVIEESLLDTFGLSKTYTINAIEIRGSKGTFDVFTELSGQVAIDTIWTDFQTRINPSTGALFTLSEFNAQVTIWENKVVQDITESITSTGREIGIMFTDGTFIIQTPGTGVAANILFVNYFTWLRTGEGIIRNYLPSTAAGHYSLFTDYSFTLQFDYYDTITSWIIDFDITAVNDTTGAPGGITYLDNTGTPQPIGTSDHWIMTSPTFVQDIFFGYATSAGGNYLVADLDPLLSWFPVTSDVGIAAPAWQFTRGTNTGVLDANLTAASGTDLNADYTFTAAANGDLTISSITNGNVGNLAFAASTTAPVVCTDGATISITFGPAAAGTGGETNTFNVYGQEIFTVGLGGNAAAFTFTTVSNAGTATIETYTFTETSTAGVDGVITIDNAGTVGTINIVSGTPLNQDVTLTDGNTINFDYDGTALVAAAATDAGSLLIAQVGSSYLTVVP